MSWLSDNYEKAAIGGAAVIAVALVAVVLKNKGELAEAFELNSPKQNKETDVRGLADITIVKTSMSEVHEIHRGDDGKGRKVELYTGVPLFSKIDDQKNPVDLLTSDSVHKGIPNTWWLKYAIDPGYSDSPDRDPDKDGFTNREEFEGGTHPQDFGSHPDPIVKLVTNNVTTKRFNIKPTDYGNGGDAKFKLQEYRGRGVYDRNKMGLQPVKPGNIIPFAKTLMQKRFKYTAVEEVELVKNGITQTEKLWVIEDQSANKEGVVYKFNRKGFLWKDPNGHLGIMDSTVELTLQALGQGGNPFKLEENNRFSLPYDEEATKKPYLLKKVDLKNLTVEVEYTDKDGKLQTHTMPFKK